MVNLGRGGEIYIKLKQRLKGICKIRTPNLCPLNPRPEAKAEFHCHSPSSDDTALTGLLGYISRCVNRSDSASNAYFKGQPSLF